MRKKRVAAYARVSTLQDEQTGSYIAQVLAYTRQIRSNPDWEFVAVYGDRGKTGTSVKVRPSFNAMIDMARRGNIDLILTKSITRFARNALDALIILRELKSLGVEVYFEEQHFSSLDPKCEMALSIMAAIAQEESRSLSENIRWGIARRMEKGEFTLPYKRFLGYKRGRNGRPEIDKRGARTVREIYKLFLADRSIGRLARYLTKLKRKTPSGGTQWRHTTVQRILTNEKYAGIALLQKTYTPNYLDHKAFVNRGNVRQYLVEDSHPAIISLSDFIATQQKLRQQGRKYNDIVLTMIENRGKRQK